MTHYVVTKKNNNRFLRLFGIKSEYAMSSFQVKDIVDFMWGKNFKDYTFYKNGNKINFSNYKISEYANLNNFEKFLNNY